MKPSIRPLMGFAGIIHFLVGGFVICLSAFFFVVAGFSLYVLFFYTISGLLLATQGYFLLSQGSDAERFGKIVMGYYFILLSLLYLFYRLQDQNTLRYLTLGVICASLIICSTTLVYFLSSKPTDNTR